jgi:two-component system sensor kinase FixL
MIMEQVPRSWNRQDPESNDHLPFLNAQKKFGLLLVPFALFMIAILSPLDGTTVSEQPFLLLFLTTLVIGIGSLVIAFITGRVFIKNGSAGIFLAGAGILIFGLGSTAAGWARLLYDPHMTGTLLTICNCIASVFILTGVAMSGSGPVQASEGGRTRGVAAMYGGIVVFVTAFSLALTRGMVPSFFITGPGPALARQIIQENTLLFFAIASLLYMLAYRRVRSGFFFWYSVSLGLIATGLLVVFIQTPDGSLISWVGRSAQYLGFVIALYAALITGSIVTAPVFPQKNAPEHFPDDAGHAYTMLVETGPDAVVVLDDNEQILLWNTAAEKMFGYSRGEAIGSSFPELALGASSFSIVRNEGKDTPLRAGSGYMPKAVEIVAKHKDGTRFPAELIVTHHRKGGKRIRTCIVRDLAERKREKEALHTSETMFRRIFEISPLGMTIVTPDLRFVSVNPSWASMTGYTEQDLLKMSFKDITYPDDLAGDMEYLQKLAAGTIPVYSAEKRYIRKDGTILWGLIKVTTIGDTQDTLRYFGAQIENITERKRAEELREHLIHELARKNAELDRFTYTVSHDLKSPLVGIRAFLTLLEDDLKAGNTAEVETDIRRIDESLGKLELLITTLLTLSRSGRIVDIPVTIPFSELAREAAQMLGSSLKELGITLEIPDNLPEVSGDRQRLLQVMTNLLDNAVKFMGEQKDPRIEVGARNEAGILNFFVKDNGMGIDPANQPKLFGLFERFNPDIPGTGIGLASVKRIIEAHGGKVWIESEGEGKGTTVCFTLPPVTKEEGHDRETKQE